jgi:hypothetical protein
MKFGQEERRYKIFTISRNFLLRMITGEVQIQNIPEWSTILEIQPNFHTRGWDFIIHHPSFPEVPEGKIATTINLEIKTLDRGVRKLTFNK